MKPFDYADVKIEGKELSIVISSAVIGVGILTFPRHIAGSTIGMDGAVSILAAGIIFTLFAWMSARMAVRFPGMNFYENMTKVFTKPIGLLIVIGFIGMSLGITALEVRSIGNMAKMYFFERTPIEVISFVFLLVVIYAVSGARAAVIRLNLLFLPIVLFIALLVQVFNINYFEFENLGPFFQSDMKQYWEGAKQTAFSFSGFILIIIYSVLIRKPKTAPKAAVFGMIIPIILYLVIYIFCIGVFSNAVTMNINYPTIEISKEVEVPGQFFERFESIFFMIWTMTIFTTTMLAFDSAVFSLQIMMPKVKKIVWVILCSPLIYMISLMPNSSIETQKLGEWLTKPLIFYCFAIPLLYFIVVKLRRL